MVTEIELKYSIFEQHSLNKALPSDKTFEFNRVSTAEQVKTTITQLLSTHHYTFRSQKKHLTNHYFDTANLALQKNKIALRTRGTRCAGEAMRFEQTIKTSGTVIAGLHQRPEYNVDIGDDKPILALFPQSIWQANTNLNQLQQNITELFSTHFIRQTWLVTLDNAQVEIAFDSGEVACENYSVKPRIYEIELELVSGDAQALFVLTKLLFSQLALRPGQLTKAARGYRLYQQRENFKANIAAESKLIENEKTLEQITPPIINLPKNSDVNDAFIYGIDTSLTQLQLCVDDYVVAPSLTILQKIVTQLALLRQGLYLFNTLLTADEITLRNELRYFIKVFDGIDTIVYLQSLINTTNVPQQDILGNKALIVKLLTNLQAEQNSYLNEAQVLALLHSERFNNLQLDLLSLLLSKKLLKEKSKTLSKNINKSTINSTTLSLTAFAAQHLTNSSNALNQELTQLSKLTYSSVANTYLNINKLLNRGLLTNSWFATLFVITENDINLPFTMPWLAIKQTIIELQSLNILQQQLVQLSIAETPTEKQLTQWLVNKSDNLSKVLEQSSTEALTIKPYWSPLP